MRPRSRSEARAAAIALGIAACLAPALARGADSAKVEYPLHFTAFWKNAAGYLEAGPGWKTSWTSGESTGSRELTLRARVPFRDKDEKLVVIDRDSAEVKLVAGADWERGLTPEEGTGSRTLRLSARAEWGTDRYAWHPGGGAEQARRRDSWGAELDGLAYLKRGGRQLAPQVRVRWAQEWQASPSAGVVIPGAGGAPDTVKELVLDPPTVKSELSVRVGVPHYFPFAGAFAAGPYASYTFGGLGDALSAAYQRLRGELWLYYFPVTKPANMRFGLAGFLDWRSRGVDDRAVREVGLLVQLRIPVTLVDY
jgi:hypothetical protein